MLIELSTQDREAEPRFTGQQSVRPPYGGGPGGPGGYAGGYNGPPGGPPGSIPGAGGRQIYVSNVSKSIQLIGSLN